MKKSIVIILTSLILFSCGKDRLLSPPADNGEAIDKLSNITVENTNGGAVIKYTLPGSKNLLYVKAVYSIRPGVEREAKSSIFKDQVIVDGFLETKEYEVKLYTVNKAEVASEPIVVKIKPLISPLLYTLGSLTLDATFGGLSVRFLNTSEADLTITVLTSVNGEKMKKAQTFYTKMANGTLSVRGFGPEKRKFAAFIRDKYDNYSDTVYAELTPLLETKINKKLFKQYVLPTDEWMKLEGSSTRTMDKLWDDNVGNGNNMFSTRVGTVIPQWFTFDVGVSATFSRMIYYPRAESSNYYSNTPRFFEIWGSNNPNPDGSWDSWTKLLSCEMIKPSGLPDGQINADDQAYSLAGIEYEFPAGTVAVRYVRFKTVDVWSGTNIGIRELTFFGSGN